MKVQKPATVVTSAMLALSLGLGLAGCNQNNAPEATEAEQSAPAEEAPAAEEEVAEEAAPAEEVDPRDVIGTQEEGAQSVTITNGLGADVAEVYIRKSGKIKFRPVDMVEGDVFAADEEAVLSFIPKSSDPETLYDVRLVLANGTKRAFFGVPLQKAESLNFLRGDRVNYVDYVQLDGSEGSTKDAALQRKAEQDEAKRVAEEEAAAAEAAAAEEVYNEEPVYEEPAYEEPVYEEPVYEEPVYEEPVSEAPAQTDDTCVPDAVFRE